MLPVHEPVQPAVGCNDVGTGPQQQVKRVAQDDVGPETFELLGRHRFYGAVGADGHEGRCLDHPVSGYEAPDARRAIRRDNFKPGPHARTVTNIASP